MRETETDTQADAVKQPFPHQRPTLLLDTASQRKVIHSTPRFIAYLATARRDCAWWSESASTYRLAATDPPKIGPTHGPGTTLGEEHECA